MDDIKDGQMLAEVDVREMLHLLRQSHEAFIEFFLADEIPEELGVEDFHLLVFSRFVDMSEPRDVCALPRDHAKTTYLRLAFLYVIYFTPVQFLVPVGATQTMAAATLQVIWNWMNEQHAVDLFGRPSAYIERTSEGLIEMWVDWYDENLEPRQKRVIIKAQGAQQAVRGMNRYGLRPQYVGCDDIEDETAVKTQEGYEKFKAWFDNTFMRAVSRQKGLNKVVQIGNLVGMQTLLNDNLSDPDWRSMRLGILRRNGTPLWPARFPPDEIKKDLEAAKRRGQLNAWFGELMNMPLNMETALVDYDKIVWSKRRHPADGTEYRSFITIDPAISQQDTADDAAVVLHTIDPAGVPQVTEYVYYKGMTPDRMAEEVVMLCEKWNCYVVGCESVALQVTLLYYFELIFSMRGMHGYSFVPIQVGRSHKTSRLMTFASALVSGEYTLAEGDWDFAAQMLNFDIRKTNNKDDLIDAGSMGIYMLENYRREIFSDRAEKLHKAMQQNQVVGSSTTI